MQHVPAASMQQEKASQQRPLPTADDAEQIWEKAEKRARDMQEASRQEAPKRK